jgi:protein involved in polysaccharide export with SLBB domain
MKRILLFVVVALLALPAAAAGQAIPPDETLIDPSEVVLKPGDAVRITVWLLEEYSGKFYIGADGSIRHPLYQAVQVAGVPIPQAEERVRQFLLRFEANPQLLIEPLFRVTVAGEVEVPDVYEFGPEVTIARAVSMAGGATRRARVNRVRLEREGQFIVINLQHQDPAQALMPIQSGDRIILERRVNWITDVLQPAVVIASSVPLIVNFVGGFFN